MTVGEKIKEARKSAGLTQEQMAEKLMVSRQAITKWEADKGIPDIGNLKSISGLLNISIDYLLDDGQTMDKSIIREVIDLKKYGKTLGVKNKFVMDKYPTSKIWPLIGKQKLAKSERVIDNILGFVFDAPFGVPDLINDMKNVDKAFYLVDQDNKQFFVMVTDEFVESREMSNKVSGKKFEIGNMIYKKNGVCLK